VTTSPRRMVRSDTPWEILRMPRLAPVDFHLSLRCSGSRCGPAPWPPGVPAAEGDTSVVQHANQQVYEVLRTVALVAAALLVVLALVTTIIAATFVALDARRSHAVLAAIGATPRQIVAGFVGAQLAAGLGAVCVGIVAGRSLYAVWANGLDRPPLSWLTYTVVVVLAVAAHGVALGLPAGLLARDRIAATLASERGTPT